MNAITFEQLLDNYCSWKNSERDASKLSPEELLYSYLFESEFLMAAIHLFRMCLQEEEDYGDATPFVDMQSNFLKHLTVEELLIICETVSQQKTKECEMLIEQLRNESK
ncbi:MAG: hypothetical protein EBY66_00690 [Candidatus Fonsibacter lacus]|nr:hypothetical protein [Candidatus Fonsibacter lacus]